MKMNRCFFVCSRILRKVVYLVSALFMLVIFSCSADNDYVNGDDHSDIEVLKGQIMEMGQEYGLDIRVNEEFIRCYRDKINLDSLDDEFRKFASIRGNYDVKNVCDGRNRSLKLGAKRMARTRGGKINYESYTSEDVVSKELNYYYCKCEVSWIEEDGKCSGVSVNASVTGPTSTGTSSDNISVTYSADKTSFTFSGTVTYSFTPMDAPMNFIELKFHVSGSMGGASWS